ncbi:MAG: type II secretion system F family protein [Boseongicola sp.]
MATVVSYAIGICIFATLLILSFLMFQYLDSRRTVRSRAFAFNPVAAGLGASGASATQQKGLQVDALSDLERTSELLYSIEKGIGVGNDKRLSEARRDMVTAGFFHQDAPSIFFAVRMFLAIGFGLASLIAVDWLEWEGAYTTYIVFFLTVGVVYLLPRFYISYRQSALKRECLRGIPDFFDMLVVSATAGVPPRAAIERISRDLAVAYPYLGANLFLTYLQLRAGLPLAEAIDALGKRIDLQEFRSFGMLLSQTEELGTKISDALRVFSVEMRARRLLLAEEKAAALPVKLVIPLALFIFPIVLLVIFLPITLRASNGLG